MERNLARLTPLARRFLSLLFIGVAAVLFACSDDDDGRSRPPDEIYEPNPDAPPGTGRLIVYTFEGGKYEPEQDVEISLYATREDMDAGIALRRAYTSRSGRVDLSFLNWGNYYLYVYKRIGEQTLEFAVVVQIQDGMTLTRNLIL